MISKRLLASACLVALSTLTSGCVIILTVRGEVGFEGVHYPSHRAPQPRYDYGHDRPRYDYGRGSGQWDNAMQWRAEERQRCNDLFRHDMRHPDYRVREMARDGHRRCTDRIR